MRKHNKLAAPFRYSVLIFAFCCATILSAPFKTYAIRPTEIKMPDEKATLGKYVPNAKLFNSEGGEFKLYEIMDGKPLVLSFVYTRCTTSCLVITDSVKEVTAKAGGLGKDFKVLTLSFDERDMVHDIEKFRQDWELDGKNWIVAAGDKEEVDKIIKAVQFDYENDQITGEFLHPNFIVILTPKGRISRYIYGVFPEQRNFKLSILEANEGSTSFSPLTDGLILRCYRYDEATGKYIVDYPFVIQMVVGVLSILTIFLIVFGKGIYARIFRRKNL